MASNLAALLFGDAKEEKWLDQSSSYEDQIVAWINSNPPNLPEPQNNCAACGEFIPVYDTGWVILGDGALIHYSGKHGKTCWEAWKTKRREIAQAAMSETTNFSNDGVNDDNGF